MITGIHGLLYTAEPEATRAVLTELLDFEFHDAGDGWLIFDAPEADLGVHPLDNDNEPFHELSFICDDIEATVERIEELGLELRQPVEDKGFGITTVVELPGGVPVQVYEPAYR